MPRLITCALRSDDIAFLTYAKKKHPLRRQDLSRLQTSFSSRCLSQQWLRTLLLRKPIKHDGRETNEGVIELMLARINVNDPGLITLVNKLQDVFTTVGVG